MHAAGFLNVDLEIGAPTRTMSIDEGLSSSLVRSSVIETAWIHAQMHAQ